jgi:hypothetical protein
MEGGQRANDFPARALSLELCGVRSLFRGVGLNELLDCAEARQADEVIP